MVYVDEIRRWPTRIRCFAGGSAHLTADTEAELHALALKIGLRREWFQAGRVPHYDLTAAKRRAAILAGAVQIAAKEQARQRIANRRAAATCAGCGDPIGPNAGRVEGIGRCCTLCAAVPDEVVEQTLADVQRATAHAKGFAAGLHPAPDGAEKERE